MVPDAGGADEEVPAPIEGSGKLGGVGVDSLLVDVGVGSLLVLCWAAGGDITPDTEPPPPLLENLMAKLCQAKGKANKMPTKM
jgi:hypothetical protein